MIDLQVVYIRDYIRLQNVDLISMLRLPASTTELKERIPTITEARISGVAVPFFRDPSGDLLLAFPAGVTGGSVVQGDASFGSISVWLYAIPTGELPDWSYLVPPEALRVDSGMLHVSGQDFRKAVTVLVNGQSVSFTILNQTSLLCAVPPGVDSLTSIEVIASVARVTGTSFFSYLMGQHPTTTTGPDKLLGQFIKALLTTPGTDMLDTKFGGGMQKWAGSRVAQANGGLESQIAIRIQTVAAQMTAGQIAAGLPPDETLAGVDILSIALDPVDQTSVNVSISLQTLSAKTVAVTMMLGGVESLANQAAGV